MTNIDACKLVSILKKENETNSEDEKAFNNEWLRLIYKSWGMAIDKAYRFSKDKTDKLTTKQQNQKNETTTI
jgi:cell division protein FtsL